MKKLFLVLLGTVVVGGVTSFADATITEFKAEPGFNLVHLRWTVIAESNLKGYQIERGLDGVHFLVVDFVSTLPGVATPHSPKVYTYVDRSIFRTSGRTFYYRLGMVDASTGKITSYSQVVTVTAEISAVRHTWGSIKAMFR